MTHPKNLMIVIAMRAEALPFIEKLRLRKIDSPFSPAPMIVFEGEFKNKSVVLLLNGVHAPTQMDLIGTLNASLTTVLGIQKFRPNIIFNFGTCGALSGKGARIGDLYLAVDRVWFHTRRIPLPGWEQMAFGGHLTAGTKALADKCGLRPGVLSSTDSLDFPALDAANFAKIDGDVADMEGAAIAWLAEMHQIPFYAIKGVTDLMDLDRKTGEQFEENLTTLAEKICDAAISMMNEVV